MQFFSAIRKNYYSLSLLRIFKFKYNIPVAKFLLHFLFSIHIFQLWEGMTWPSSRTEYAIVVSSRRQFLSVVWLFQKKKKSIKFLFWPAVPCHWQNLCTKEHYFSHFERTSDFSDSHSELISLFQYQFERFRFGTYFPPFEWKKMHKKRENHFLFHSVSFRQIEIITENYYYFLSSLSAVKKKLRKSTQLFDIRHQRFISMQDRNWYFTPAVLPQMYHN